VASEVTTLKHELGNNTMETGFSISISMFTSTQLAEVLCSLRYNIIKQLEDDGPRFVAVDFDVEL
jgi:hypothetical protein